MSFTPTPRQREAIEAALGPVLVVAGPGAGKTFCLIGRIERLIDHHALVPERILAVTFTNKAADEISHRLAEGGPGRAGVTRGTLHALCLRLLREFPEPAGLRPGFGVADDEYARALLRRLRVREQELAGVLRRFDAARHQGAALEPRDERLFSEFRRQLRRHNLVDFDDLILHTATLLETHADVRDDVLERWDAVLVDEFQDLTPTQYAIVARLAERHRHLFAVGDDEQSIYGWAGADPGILDRFARDFGITAPVVLETNHRNTRAIFETARRLLRANPTLFEKELTAPRESDVPVAALSFDTDRDEARWLIEDLVADRAADGPAWRDYAVLVRAHWIAEVLEGELLQAGVPVRTARGRAIRDDPIAQPVFAAFHLARDPSDRTPVELLARWFLQDHVLEALRVGYPGMPLVRALRAYGKDQSVPDADGRQARRLYRYLANIPAMARAADTLGDFVDALLEQRPSEHRTRFEDEADRLSDPEDLPAARELADALVGLQASGGAIHITAAGGLDVALRGMLGAAGLAHHLADRSGTPGPDDLVLDARTPGIPFRLFKALQRLTAARSGLRLDDCVTFDVETTGTDTDSCAIVELGAVRVRGGEVVDRFHALVDPGVPIPPEATGIHGYGDADVAGQPAFAEIWPAFREFLGEDLLVAHNGREFDVPVLHRHVRAAGDREWNSRTFDTLPLAQVVSTRRRLADLAAHFGVDTGRVHHALDDALTLAHVLRGLVAGRAAFHRRTAFASGLDWLGLALVLERGERTEEEQLLAEIARIYTLGRYSDCLERYDAARPDDAPTLDEVVERLGGQALMRKLRERKGSAADRYPSSVLRLRRLLEPLAHLPVEEGVARALELVALSSHDGPEAEADALSLLTLHATKGLEFSRVYIVGVEDHQIPGWRAIRDNRHDEFPEARRLLYVGMTRARDRLVLTRCLVRGGHETGGAMLLEEMGFTFAPRPEEASAGAPTG